MKRFGYWNSISIRTRALITQIALIIVPMILCIAVLFRQVSVDSQTSNADATYQYNRYIINSLNTAVRQMESMANTIAGNRFVRQYISMADTPEREALFQESIMGQLRYSYNRYLPTHDIEIIPNASLADVKIGENVLYYHRSEYRMWTFTTAESQPECCFYYQFSGNQGKTGVIRFSPTSAMLTEPVQSISSINKQSCIVAGIDRTPLYIPESLNSSDVEIIRSVMNTTTEGYQLIGDKKALYCMQCDALPLIFVSVQPMTNAWQFSQSLLPYLGFILLLIAGCIYLSYQVFFNGITKRIIRLSDACESLQLDQIGRDESGESPLGTDAYDTVVSLSSVPIMGSDEIGTLSVSINDMIRRIVDLTNQNAREVRTAQRAAYDMLAAQIHPHFIYNTLENLRMMAEINDDQEVADNLYALGRMLRQSISDASSIGSVSVEIEHAQMYLQLQKMRMDNRLQYEISPIDDDILQMQCPRFLLQPLVENAIKHGFQQQKMPGRISISAGREGEHVYLRVYNDGEGFSDDRLAQVRESLKTNQPITDTRGGIGLINVNMRLRMFYGGRAGLTIDSGKESGTTCTLWLITSE